MRTDKILSALKEALVKPSFKSIWCCQLLGFLCWCYAFWRSFSSQQPVICFTWKLLFSRKDRVFFLNTFVVCYTQNNQSANKDNSRLDYHHGTFATMSWLHKSKSWHLHFNFKCSSFIHRGPSLYFLCTQDSWWFQHELEDVGVINRVPDGHMCYFPG